MDGQTNLHKQITIDKQYKYIKKIPRPFERKRRIGDLRVARSLTTVAILIILIHSVSIHRGVASFKRTLADDKLAAVFAVKTHNYPGVSNFAFFNRTAETFLWNLSSWPIDRIPYPVLRRRDWSTRHGRTRWPLTERGDYACWLSM